jgi:hypothetical protein
MQIDNAKDLTEALLLEILIQKKWISWLMKYLIIKIIDYKITQKGHLKLLW